MSDEIKAAAERLLGGQYYGDGGNIISAIKERKADGLLVAKAYLAVEAAREAELLPIDQAWQRSIGFTDPPLCKGPLTLGSVTTYARSYGVDVFLGSQRIVLKTRAQLLAWLCIQGVPTKQQQNDTSNPETEVTNA